MGSPLSEPLPHENVLSIERLLSLLLGERSLRPLQRARNASASRSPSDRQGLARRQFLRSPEHGSSASRRHLFHHTCAERLVTEGASSGYPDVSSPKDSTPICTPSSSGGRSAATRAPLGSPPASLGRCVAPPLCPASDPARRRRLVTAEGSSTKPRPVKREAPSYRRGMPLGTIGCDGSGIALAEAVGAQTRHMDRISAWRFISPPLGFSAGVLVDGSGRRFVNEALYGAALGEAIVERAQGRGVSDPERAPGTTEQSQPAGADPLVSDGACAPWPSGLARPATQPLKG